jgi:hypothetical protein
VQGFGNVIRLQHTTRYRKDTTDKHSAAFLFDVVPYQRSASEHVKVVLLHGNYGNFTDKTGKNPFLLGMFEHTLQCIKDNNYDAKFLKVAFKRHETKKLVEGGKSVSSKASTSSSSRISLVGEASKTTKNKTPVESTMFAQYADNTTDTTDKDASNDLTFNSAFFEESESDVPGTPEQDKTTKPKAKSKSDKPASKSLFESKVIFINI